MNTQAQISNIAATLRRTGETTKTAIKAALKAAGMRQTLADDVLAEVTRQNKAKSENNARKRGTFLRPNKSRRPEVLLPGGTPAKRLQWARNKAVLATFNETYRVAVHGNQSVILTDSPALVGVKQVEGIDWNLYRGSHKGRPARTQDTTLTVPATWRVRVQRAGLAVVDGMMTLDAAPIEATGCSLFAATWIVQGRGTSVSAVSGYIARAGLITFHADSIAAALAGLARKQKSAADEMALATGDFANIVAQYGSRRVTVGDARAVGACEYGIESWCHAVGLSDALAVGETDLATMVAAYQREPRREARATILRVIRRQGRMAA